MKLFHRPSTKSGDESRKFGMLESLLMLAAMHVLLVVSCLAFGWEKIVHRQYPVGSALFRSTRRR